MTKDIKRYKAWVLTWASTASRGNVPVGLPSQEAPLALFPAQTSKPTIEGAMLALLQVLENSSLEIGIGYVRRAPGRHRVEWDSPGRNARVGHSVEVWAQLVELTYDRSELALESTRGEGQATYVGRRWMTRQEHWTEIRDARAKQT